MCKALIEDSTAENTGKGSSNAAAVGPPPNDGNIIGGERMAAEGSKNREETSRRRIAEHRPPIGIHKRTKSGDSERPVGCSCHHQARGKPDPSTAETADKVITTNGNGSGSVLHRRLQLALDGQALMKKTSTHGESKNFFEHPTASPSPCSTGFSRPRRHHDLCAKCGGTRNPGTKFGDREVADSAASAGHTTRLINTVGLATWRKPGIVIGGGCLGRLLRKRVFTKPSTPPSSTALSPPSYSEEIIGGDETGGLGQRCSGRMAQWKDSSWGKWGAGTRVRVVVGCLLALFAVCWAVMVAVRETYIWSYGAQVRAFRQLHVPRGECPIVKLTRERIRGGWDQPRLAGPDGRGKPRVEGVDGAGVQEAEGAGDEGGKRRLRFGIVMMCDEGMWPAKYTQMSIENKKAYAAIHGYDVVLASSADVDRSRPAAWSKIIILKAQLSNYDYLMFIDIDAFVMNPSFKLEWLLDVARTQQQHGGVDGWGDSGKEPDLIVTKDWSGPNSGVILVKNSSFSHWLLDEWWDQDQFVTGNYPFQYEQRALHFLLQPDAWRNAGHPYYADHATVRKHTAVIDQCAMNSYLVHPWQRLLGRTGDLGQAASYFEGDFILHFAGRKGRVREQLVEYYYPRAKQAMEVYKSELERVPPGAPGPQRQSGQLRGARLP